MEIRLSSDVYFYYLNKLFGNMGNTVVFTG